MKMKNTHFYFSTPDLFFFFHGSFWVPSSGPVRRGEQEWDGHCCGCRGAVVIVAGHWVLQWGSGAKGTSLVFWYPYRVWWARTRWARLRGGGRGCRVPGQKQERKKKTHFFFSGIHTQCGGRRRDGPGCRGGGWVRVVIVVAIWAWGHGLCVVTGGVRGGLGGRGGERRAGWVWVVSRAVFSSGRKRRKIHMICQVFPVNPDAVLDAHGLCVLPGWYTGCTFGQGACLGMFL
jgi:hypothetical protein